MDWGNERYVRVYTRDTVTWKLLDWRARAVLLHLFRKVDRAGVLDVGSDGVLGLAAILELPSEIVEAGVVQLVTRGTVVETADAYVVPNFLPAQEAASTDAQRQREARARRRDLALVTNRDAKPTVTKRDATVTNRDGPVTKAVDTVTVGHSASQPVTPSRADPSVPSEPIHATSSASSASSGTTARTRARAGPDDDDVEAQKRPSNGRGKRNDYAAQCHRCLGRLDVGEGRYDGAEERDGKSVHLWRHADDCPTRHVEAGPPPLTTCRGCGTTVYGWTGAERPAHCSCCPTDAERREERARVADRDRRRAAASKVAPPAPLAPVVPIRDELPDEDGVPF